ncbi:MAG: DUF1573 domain-containing protein [Lutibacter sp.]
MRKTAYLLVLTVAFLAMSCKNNAAAKVKSENVKAAQQREAKTAGEMPVIAFNQRAYEFGTIHEGDKINGSFTIYNKGNSDLVISSAKASCGCTIPSWPKDAIKPGDSAQLKFVFNSRGKHGKQNKSITLNTNTNNVTEVIRLTGNVIKKQ